MALQIINIKELQKINFHIQKGLNFGDTVEERLSSRTTSKARFKCDTWPTCHPKRELLHQISLKTILHELLMKVKKCIGT
jgi:hypothetical protein